MKDKIGEELTVKIVPFRDDFKGAVKALNYEWLQKYFKVEDNDALVLSDPQKYIIDKGGYIFCASCDGIIVGTVSLLKINDKVFELGKMGVSSAYQGKGIGKRLLTYALDVAQQQNIQRLILFSDRKLAPALHLYEKYGFKEVTFEPGHYERGDIKMQKDL